MGFLFSSSLSILARAFAIAPILGLIYLLVLLTYALGWLKLRPPLDPIMFNSPLSAFNLFIFCTLQLSRFSNAQHALSTTGTPTSFRPIFTVPSAADVGMYTCPANLFLFQTTPYVVRHILRPKDSQ